MSAQAANIKAELGCGDFRSQAGIGWCQGIIEACWLAALILVPCLCNPFAESAFQPAKIFIFRVLAILVAAAWLCKAIVFPPRPGGWIVRFTSACRGWPMVWALAAMAAIYILANCFSIYPGESFWGEYEMRQGSFTFLCGLLFVAAVGMHLRRGEQVERLVSAISVTGFVLALYAIFERTGHGTLPVPDHQRVSSFLGHPVFFADYLVLIMPITAWRILRLAGSVRSNENNRTFYWAGLIVYAVSLITQFSALYFTGSRAGLLGWVAGVIFVALTITALDQRRSRLLGGFGIIVVILALLAVLNLPNGPFKRLTNMPILTRYTQLFSQSQATALFRLNFWNAAARILSWKKPLEFPGDGTDRWHFLRPVIGYGPETLGSILSREYTNPGPNPTLENRVHNSFWDTWLSLGILGVAAQTALLFLVFYQVYRRLGLMYSFRRKCLFFGGTIALSLGGGLLLAALFHNVGLAGAGLELGMGAGFLLFPLTAFFLKGDAAMQAKISLKKNSLLVFMLAGLLSHLVDNTFAFETSATLVVVAIYLGTILALDREEWGTNPESPAPIHGSSHSNWPVSPMSNVYPAIGTGLILVSLLFALINFGSSYSSAWGIIISTLTPFGDVHSSQGLSTLLFLLVSWLFAAFSFGWGQDDSMGSSNWVKRGVFVLIASGALAVAFALFQGQMLARIGPFPSDDATLRDVHRQGIGYLQICLGFIGFCLLSVLAAGLSFRVAKPPAGRPASRLVPTIYLAAAAAAIWFLSVPFLEAQVFCRWASLLGGAGESQLAAGLYGQVVDLDPAPLIYRGIYAQTLEKLAEVNRDPLEYDDLMSKAEIDLLRRPRPGRDATDLYLGELYLQWGAHQESTNEQVKLGLKANSAFQNAQQFDPENQLAWRENSIVNDMLLHNGLIAQAELERARAITTNQDSQFLGDYFNAKSASVVSPGLRQQYGACAIEYYDRALAIAGTNTDAETLLQLHLQRGYDYLLLGKGNAAIQDYSDAAKFTAQPDSWKAEFWLARIYAHDGRIDLFDQHLQRALLAAPPDQKQMLLAWKLRMASQ